MRYYSTMSLADYMNANWMELPPELVALYEREAARFDDQTNEIEHWKESYDLLKDDADQFLKAVEDCIDEQVYANRDLGDFILELRDVCSSASFYEAW